MEKAKKTSSFTSELFGPKDSPKSSSSSTGHFGALFGQSSTGLGKDSMHNEIARSIQQHHHHTNHSANGKQESFGKGERNGSTGKEPNSYSQNGSEEPCYFSSSIYYGGQEVYSVAAKNPNYQHKKDSGEDDSNATRGNWWQGSLYY